MALSDYTTLKAAIASDWLHRTDLTTAIGDFITLFETEFNSDVRHREMEAQTSLTSTAGYLLHPTNWLGWKQITATDSGSQYNLDPAPDEYAVEAVFGEGSTSTPTLYKVRGSRTYLYPTSANVSYSVKYWEGVSLSSGTNWLLTRYPQAYLYGALLKAVKAIGDDPRYPMWKQEYEQTLERIKSDSRKQSWSNQVLKMRPDRVV